MQKKKKIALLVVGGMLLFCCFPVGCLTAIGGRAVGHALRAEEDSFVSEPSGIAGAANPSLPKGAKLGQMNQPVDVGDVRYTIISRRGQSAVGKRIFFDFLGEKAAKGATYVIVTYTIENLTKKPIETLLSDDLQLFDATGRQFLPSTSAETALMFSDGLGSLQTKEMYQRELQPGVPYTKHNVFEVPLDAVQTPGLMVVVPTPGSLEPHFHIEVQFDGHEPMRASEPAAPAPVYVPIN